MCAVKITFKVGFYKIFKSKEDFYAKKSGFQKTKQEDTWINSNNKKKSCGTIVIDRLMLKTCYDEKRQLNLNKTSNKNISIWQNIFPYWKSLNNLSGRIQQNLFTYLLVFVSFYPIYQPAIFARANAAIDSHRIEL